MMEQRCLLPKDEGPLPAGNSFRSETGQCVIGEDGNASGKLPSASSARPATAPDSHRVNKRSQSDTLYRRSHARMAAKAGKRSLTRAGSHGGRPCGDLSAVPQAAAAVGRSTSFKETSSRPPRPGKRKVALQVAEWFPAARTDPELLKKAKEHISNSPQARKCLFSGYGGFQANGGGNQAPAPAADVEGDEGEDGDEMTDASSPRQQTGGKVAHGAAAEAGHQGERVRVAVRVRPLLPAETKRGVKVCVSASESEKMVTVAGSRTYCFDEIFNAQATQEHLYRAVVEPLVQDFMSGFNATVFAYGQTGSGKTYTMGTAATIVEEEEGILPRVIQDVFDAIQSQQDGFQCHVRCQFLEVWNEEVRDLLRPHRSAADRDGGRGEEGPVVIREAPDGSITVTNVRQLKADSRERMQQLFLQGCESRTTAATLVNEASSRSHAIFTIILHRYDIQSDGVCTTSKFHLVDLAGSERTKKTGTSGLRLKEAININQGLLALGNVISALGDPRFKHTMHIPYRQAKITRLLQDSLGGNSRTLMISCVSMADIHMEETLNTLKYANRTRNITNRPINHVLGLSEAEKERLLQELHTALEDATDEQPLLPLDVLRSLPESCLWELLVQGRDARRVQADAIRSLQAQVGRLQDLPVRAGSALQRLQPIIAKCSSLVQATAGTYPELLPQEVHVLLQVVSKSCAELGRTLRLAAADTAAPVPVPAEAASSRAAASTAPPTGQRAGSGGCSSTWEGAGEKDGLKPHEAASEQLPAAASGGSADVCGTLSAAGGAAAGTNDGIEPATAGPAADEESGMGGDNGSPAAVPPRLRARLSCDKTDHLLESCHSDLIRELAPPRARLPMPSQQLPQQRRVLSDRSLLSHSRGDATSSCSPPFSGVLSATPDHTSTADQTIPLRDSAARHLPASAGAKTIIALDHSNLTGSLTTNRSSDGANTPGRTDGEQGRSKLSSAVDLRSLEAARPSSSSPEPMMRVQTESILEDLPSPTTLPTVEEERRARGAAPWVSSSPAAARSTARERQKTRSSISVGASYLNSSAMEFQSQIVGSPLHQGLQKRRQSTWSILAAWMRRPCQPANQQPTSHDGPAKAPMMPEPASPRPLRVSFSQDVCSIDPESVASSSSMNGPLKAAVPSRWRRHPAGDPASPSSVDSPGKFSCTRRRVRLSLRFLACWGSPPPAQ